MMVFGSGSSDGLVVIYIVVPFLVVAVIAVGMWIVFGQSDA